MENQTLVRCQQIRNKVGNDAEWCSMKSKPSPIVKRKEVVNDGNSLKISHIHSQSLQMKSKGPITSGASRHIFYVRIKWGVRIYDSVVILTLLDTSLALHSFFLVTDENTNQSMMHLILYSYLREL